MKLDPIDYRILFILQSEGRIPIQELARRARVSVPTIRQRLSKLINKGVIKRFTILLDPKYIAGYHDVFIWIDVKPSEITRVVNKLTRMEEVLGVYRIIGEHDLLLRVAVQSYADLDEFISKKISSIRGILSLRTNMVINVLKDEPSPKLMPGVSLRVYCAVCGKEIEGRPIKRRLDGKEYYLCCSTCASSFDRRTIMSGGVNASLNI